MENVAAFVFAAGLGTRLYPLTASRPKAMVRYQNKPLIQHVLDKIIEAGIRHIVVNVHHFPDQIIEFVHNHHFDADIRFSDERAYLRDTAGGLKFAEPLLPEGTQLLLYNVDIISSINLQEMVRAHRSSDAAVTLAVRDRKTARYFVFDADNGRLCGWKNLSTGECRMGAHMPTRTVDLAFSGIHLMNRTMLSYIPTVEKSSITALYLQIMNNFKIQGYLHQNDEWMDVGKFDEFCNILK